MRVRWMAGALALVAVFLLGTAGAASAAGELPDRSAQTNDVVRAIVYHGSTVYIGGNFTAVRPGGALAGSGLDVPRNHLAALDATTGNLVGSFDHDVNGQVYALAIQGETLYVGGRFTLVDGVARKNLAAIDLTTDTLLPWDPKAGAAVQVIKIGPNGNVFVGGSFQKLRTLTRTFIGEVTPAGKGDILPWSPRIGQLSGFACPPRCLPQIFTIAFDGSTVYFGGHFGLVNGLARDQAAAVDLNDSSVVRDFAPNIYAPTNCETCPTHETHRVYNMIISPDYPGRIYMCGGFWRVNNQTARDYNLGAYDRVTGKLDTTFQAWDDGDTVGCDIRNGVLYFGGHFNNVGPQCPFVASTCVVRHHVAAVRADTGALLPWDPTANSNHGVYTVVHDDAHVGFGGYFTHFGRTLQQGFAHYLLASKRLPDVQAPSAPGNVTAAVSGTTVHVAWSASTDEFGVASYGIYRDGVRVGTVSSATSFDDAGVPAGDHDYTVDAVDGSGNLSQLSFPAHVTVAG